MKALDNLDEVVRLIRASSSKEEAKKELMAKYSLSDKQSNAVLDLRLYQLTGLEREKIEKEYNELLAKIEHYKAILANEEMVKDIIREELGDIKKAHKSERMTKIIAQEGEFQMEDLIADEQVVIAISNDDYIKRMPTTSFREQKRGGQGVLGMDMKKETDALKNIYVASTHDYLMIFTSLGRCYWLKVWQIPSTGRRSKGRPLINLLGDLQKDESITAVLKVKSFEEKACIMMATEKGVVKKTELSAYSNIRKKGINAIKIDDGDKLISAHLVYENQQIMLFTKNGMAVRFDGHLVRSMGRVSRGVRGILLKNVNDKVVSCEVVSGDESILVVCENGYGKRSKVDHFRQTNRGGVGVRSILTSVRNGFVIGAVSVTDLDSVIMMSILGQTLRASMKDVRVMGRSTQGVRLVNLRAGDKLLAIQKVEGVEAAEVAEEEEEK